MSGTSARRPRKPRRPATPKATAASAAPPGAASALEAGALARGLGRAGWAATRWLFAQEETRRLLALACLGGSFLIGSHLIRARVERSPAAALDRRTLAANIPPCGLSQRARDDLARLPLPVDPHVFDPRVVPVAAACLQDLPWVAEVVRVELEPERGLTFELRPRQPLARLGEQAGAPLVTRDGVLIAADYAEAPQALPALLGVPAAQDGPARQRALAAARDVLLALEGLPLEVASIDVSNLGGGRDPLASEITFTTREGLVVEWGRPPEDPRPHVPAAAKRTLLERLTGLPAEERARLGRVSLRWTPPTCQLRPEVPVEVAAR